MARLKTIDKITFRDILLNPGIYDGLSDGLVQLPIPETIKIHRKIMTVPMTLDEFSENICYGQRLFLMSNEPNEPAVILRIMTCFYFPGITGKKWDSDLCLQIGKYILPCTAILIYPVAMHLIKLLGELADREKNLIHREPTKLELAAGIEKLNVFSKLASLDYLRDLMKIPVPEVLLTPYSECLVRLMMAHEQDEYQKRYMDLLRVQSDPKNKFKYDNVNA
jgi:hypothetical protein